MKNFTKVGGLTSNDILLGRRKVKIGLALNNRKKGLVLYWQISSTFSKVQSTL